MADDPNWLTNLHMQILAGGTWGGIVGSLVRRQYKPWEVATSGAAGGFVAYYFSETVSSYTGFSLWPVVGVLGLIAVFACEGMLIFAKWKITSYVKGKTGVDRKTIQ